MSARQNEDDPDLPAADGKAPCPRVAEPRTSVASRGWALAKKVLRIVVGVILLILGLAALFTPFTPGSWLALVGLEFLGLRVLLRNWVCARARAKPESRLRRVACRVLSLGHRKTTKRKWWRRRREGS